MAGRINGRPRILMLAPFVPRPRYSGGLMRSYEILRALAEVGDVTLVAFGGSSSPELEGVRGLCQDIHLLEHRRVPPFQYWRRLSSVQKVLRALGSPLPAMFAVYRDPRAGELFRRLRPASYDFIWQEQAATALADRYFSAQRVVLDLYDVNYVRMQRELAVARVYPTKLVDWLDQVKWRAYERHRLARYAWVVVCSENDRKALPLPRVQVTPNCVEVPAPELGDELPGEMLYLGNMGYSPNIDAVEYFCGAVLPAIRARRPDAGLCIVGIQPAERVWALHDGRTVHVVGPVEDVKPFLRRAQVVVVPLRAGGGTRIKILEALALGRPVVSTTVGAEGLELTDGRELFIADEPAVFADRCLRLLGDADLRRRLGEMGRTFVEAHYSVRMMRESVRRITADAMERGAEDVGAEGRQNHL